MNNRLISFLCSIVLGLGLLVSGTSDASAQVRITVGGLTYDITANDGSFDTVQTNTGNQLTNTTTAPWFTGVSTDSTDAAAFRDAYRFAATPTSIPSNDLLIFAHATPDGTFTLLNAINNGIPYGSGNFVNATPGSNLGGSVQYATATLVQVPEINGSALAQMLLVLLVGYLMVWARRAQT